MSFLASFLKRPSYQPPAGVFPEPVPVPADALDLAGQMLRAFEGCERKLSDGRIAPYLDSAGVPTIGWGNTKWEDGRRVTMTDQPITAARAEALFMHHLAEFMQGVKAEIPIALPHQQAAFTSFAYNVGIGGFRSSSALRMMKSGAIASAADAMELWNKADGRVVKGLQRRRRAEALVLKGLPWPDARREGEKAFP